MTTAAGLAVILWGDIFSTHVLAGRAAEATGGGARRQLGDGVQLLRSPLRHPVSAALAEGRQPRAHQGTVDQRGESVSLSIHSMLLESSTCAPLPAK